MAASSSRALLSSASSGARFWTARRSTAEMRSMMAARSRPARSSWVRSTAVSEAAACAPASALTVSLRCASICIAWRRESASRMEELPAVEGKREAASAPSRRA